MGTNSPKYEVQGRTQLSIYIIIVISAPLQIAENKL